MYRDGTGNSDPDLQSRRSHFEDIFMHLELKGIECIKLQAAALSIELAYCLTFLGIVISC